MIIHLFYGLTLCTLSEADLKKQRAEEEVNEIVT